MRVALDIKPFSFLLRRPLKTSTGLIDRRQGFLLRLSNSDGRTGWGEVSPFQLDELKLCERSLEALGRTPLRKELEAELVVSPAPLAFGIGAALAELDFLIGEKTSEGWLKPPRSAFLLPSGKDALVDLSLRLGEVGSLSEPLTFKMKVGIATNSQEISLCEQILARMPASSRLRLDANGSWNKSKAMDWAEHFRQESRIEWFEQPLPANDLYGLRTLAKYMPVALDESLLEQPALREDWNGWQVRRPLLEGDPRVLLRQLKDGIPYRMISTTFETGIGLRWIHHLAALQKKGPSPTAPGLAPGWCPEGPLFSSDPELVWLAA